MSSDRVEARRPGQSTRRTRSMRGETYTAPRRPLRPGGTLMPEAHAPETFFGLDVQVPRSKASGVGLGGPREQDRTMVEFYTEVGTVYKER
jgi:hypothetical protein